MEEVIFDTNLVIDVENKREGYEKIISLLEEEKKANLKIHVPAIVASEKTISGQKITNFNQFKEYMKNLGFKNVELLKPICYLGMCFSNYCILAGEEIVKLPREIHKLLFDRIEFDHQEYCKNRNIDHKLGIQKEWRNALIDTLVLWSAVYYGKNILVTRDGNFHRNKETILSKWKVQVKQPAELLIEVSNND
jgi:hypothetical protein